MEHAEPSTRVVLRCTPAVREKWSLVCEIAERVAGQRHGAGEVLELGSAEAFSELSIAPAFAEGLGEPPDRWHREAESSRRDARGPTERAPARGLPHAVASLVSGLEEADAFELDRRLRRAVRLE